MPRWSTLIQSVLVACIYNIWMPRLHGLEPMSDGVLSRGCDVAAVCGSLRKEVLAGDFADFVFTPVRSRVAFGDSIMSRGTLIKTVVVVLDFISRTDTSAAAMR